MQRIKDKRQGKYDSPKNRKDLENPKAVNSEVYKDNPENKIKFLFTKNDMVEKTRNLNFLESVQDETVENNGGICGQSQLRQTRGQEK